MKQNWRFALILLVIKETAASPDVIERAFGPFPIFQNQQMFQFLIRMGQILPTIEEEEEVPSPALIEREEKLRMMTEKCFQPINRTPIFESRFLPALHELIGPQLKVLNITGFIAHCPSSRRKALIRAVIFRISHYAPNLVRLHAARDRKLRGVQWEKNIYADDKIVEALSKLKQLEVLQLEAIIFNLPNLLKLSAKLTHLRLISTNLTEIIALPAVEDLKESFDGLKVFLFWIQDNSIKQFAFTRLCIENIPTLQVVGNFASDFCTLEDYILKPEFLRPGFSGLRHFTVNLNYEFIPKDLDTRFNKINHLKIIWTNVGNGRIVAPNQQVDKTTKNLTKITSLDLRGVPLIKILVHFLPKYGSNLIALHVADVETYQINLTYNQVFRACPNLEKLFLDVPDLKERITEKFPPLKELKLNLERLKENSYSLYDILRAPKLEKIELMGELTYPEDLDKLQPLLTGRPRRLRKLKTLIVNIGWADVTYSIQRKQIYFKKISSFLRDAMNELKWTLTGIKFSLNDSCEYLQLYNCIHQEAAKSEIETSLGPSFKNVNKHMPRFKWLHHNTRLISDLNRFKIKYYTI